MGFGEVFFSNIFLLALTNNGHVICISILSDKAQFAIEALHPFEYVNRTNEITNTLMPIKMGLYY